MCCKNPFLSLIVPVYNVEKYINDCLTSIINQSFEDYEVVLVDDGSTDTSGYIADTYAQKDERISVIHKENGGLSSARNAGIQACTGEYLFFIDSDDILDTECALEKIASCLRETKPEVLLFPPKEYDETLTNIVISHDEGKWQQNKIYNSLDILDELYYENSPWVTMAMTKIINKDFCIANSLYFVDKIYHEDDEWISRTLNCNPKVAFLYDPVYGYRHRENSIITTKNEKVIYKKICDRVTVACGMLNNDNCMNSKTYSKYVFDYLFNSIIRAGDLSDEYIYKFCKFADAKFLKNTKIEFGLCDIKIIVKVLYIKLFGIKKFIFKYKR